MDLIDIAIAKSMSGGGGGGSSLPSVTSADAGKVLAVNDSGEWAADNKLVQLKVDPDTFLTNLTVREIIQAFIDGAIVYTSSGYINENDPSECLGVTTFYGGVEYNGSKFELTNADGSVVALTPDNSLDSYFNFD